MGTEWGTGLERGQRRKEEKMGRWGDEWRERERIDGERGMMRKKRQE